MRRTFTALLVDDDPAANQGMMKLLGAHPQIQVVGVFNSVADATLFLQQGPQPDVVFLDMEMPGRHGLELLPALHPSVRIVFVTASEAYALRAFDEGAIDYLVKPICPDRLVDTVQRLTSRIAPGDQEATGEDEEAPERVGEDAKKFMITTPRSGFTQLVDIDQILWIESLQNYSKAYLKDEPMGVVLLRKISLWEALLPATDFSRLGRCLIVATKHVCSTEWRSREETMVSFVGSKASLMISRASAARLKKVLRENSRDST